MPAKPASKPETPLMQEAKKRIAMRRYVINGMNASKTALDVGVSHTTIDRWWKELSPDEQQSLKDNTNEDIAGAWRTLEDAAIYQLMERIPDAKTHDLAVIAGIAGDHAMKYLGVADNTNVTLSESPDDIATKIQAILKGAKSNTQVEAHTQCAEGTTLPA